MKRENESSSPLVWTSQNPRITQDGLGVRPTQKTAWVRGPSFPLALLKRLSRLPSGLNTHHNPFLVH